MQTPKIHGWVFFFRIRVGGSTGHGQKGNFRQDVRVWGFVFGGSKISNSLGLVSLGRVAGPGQWRGIILHILMIGLLMPRKLIRDVDLADPLSLFFSNLPSYLLDLTHPVNDFIFPCDTKRGWTSGFCPDTRVALSILFCHIIHQCERVCVVGLSGKM